MADEEKSVLSSLSVMVSSVTGNSKRILEAGRREALKGSLAAAA
jgi:hypothetical protein